MKIRLTQRRFWLLIAAAILLISGASVLIVGMRPKPNQPAVARGPMVYWMPPPTPQQARSLEYVAADLLDPSLLSLPSLHGFSRELWEHRLPATHRPFEPVPQLAFLDVKAPTNAPLLLEQTPLTDLVYSSAEKASAESEPESEAESVPRMASPDRSVVQVVEPVTNRAIIQLPDLPAIASDIPLRPTRVRIGVASDGMVRYAILDRSAGSGAASSAADAQALESARGIRFDSQLGGDDRTLAWGVLRFVWAITPPTAPTNEAQAAAPQPR